jgi:diguanylate cyclase
MLFSFGKKYPEGHEILNRTSECERSREIIEMLSQAVAGFDADNREYNRSMLEQSRRLEEITGLDDLQRLKRALLRETDRLRQAVRAKVSRETARIEKLTLQVPALNREVQRLRTASDRDSLTGICNRRTFDRHLDDLIARNNIQAEPFALLMIDIDDFKRINEAYGHLAGDRVLATLVNKCRRSVRRQDLLARYGGEELAILLAGACLRNAIQKSRQICESVAAARYVLEEMPAWEALAITVSIGVSAWCQGDTAAALVGRADQALSAAKGAGKNRVVSQKDLA